MSEFTLRNAYLLETAKGSIQLSKGMWLSLLRRRAQLGKETEKKQRVCQQDNTKTAMRSRLVNFRKTISKVRTICKTQLPYRVAGMHRGRTVSLVRDNMRRTFKLFDDSQIFPRQIQQFQIAQSFDNDCESDDEEIRKSLNNVLMSLCLAVHDNRLAR